MTSTSKTGRALIACATALAAAALGTPLASQALASRKASGVGAPLVNTGGVSHVRGTTAELDGAVDPRGAATTYYFQYGPTVAYGSQTTPGTLPAGTVNVKVGQTATKFLAGYHYRLVATNQFGTRNGRDRAYSTKKKGLKLELAHSKEKESKEPPVQYGGTFVVSGTLSGNGNALHALVLQATPYPYHADFATIGTTVYTNTAGAFTFRVKNMTQNTEFRVSTVDPRPTYSKTVTAHVAVKVTFKARPAKTKGLYRLYGTITPAKVGARVYVQLNQAIKPGRSKKSEKTSRFVSQFATVAKRGTKALARFSTVVNVTRTGSYRVFVKLRIGAQVSGYSQTIVLHAPSSEKGRKRTAEGPEPEEG